MKQSELYAYIGTAISVIIILLILLFVFLPSLKVEGDDGMMISFGEVFDGGGSITENSQEQSTPTNTPKADVKEDILTQEDESVAIPDTKKPDPKPSKEEEKRKQEEERRRKEEEAAKKIAQETSDAFSAFKGSGQTTGDETAGNPVSSGTFGGHSWSVDGNRGLIRRPPDPKYNENVEGKITVLMEIDKTGKVIRATIVPPTNIPDESLRKAAIDATLSAQFSGGDASTKGTITYNFRYKTQ